MSNMAILLLFCVPAAFVALLRVRATRPNHLSRISYNFELFVWSTSIITVIARGPHSNDLNAHELFFVCAMALARFLSGASLILGDPKRKI